MSRATRQGRIYIDFQRNNQGATTVAAYSTRARADASVSLPLAWSELAELPGPASIHLNDVRAWLPPLRDDPWSELPQVRQSLTARMWAAVDGHRDP
jgi:bifunctional non-homologous end joining protein LigD